MGVDVLDHRAAGRSAAVPLVVDLDGSLIAADLLAETAILHLARRPLALPVLLGQLRRGRSALKHHLAALQPVDVARLPYRDDVLALIAAAREEGRPVHLATASHHSYAAAIGEHLGLFDEVFATTPDRNLSGRAKAALLVERFGEGGFDYVGNSTADLAVWAHARRCYAVGAGAGLARRLAALGKEHALLAPGRPTLRVWARALRVHQWAKNTLLFLPLVAGHALRPELILCALIAFLAFSLVASSVYLVNDLLDLADDRGHPSKRHRPLASGQLPIHHAVAAAPALLLAGFLLALPLPRLFLVELAGYLCLTTAYSVWLKRKMLVDVVVLAMLYTVRVGAGGAATGIAPSDWLLAFCLFAFTSLALMKRYTELLVRLDRALPDSSNRGYRQTDLPVISALAAVTGVNTVTVLALYVRSPEVMLLYRRPDVLWLLCPLLLYLVSRALLVAHRREMDDDPLVWALRDRACRIGLVLAGGIVVAGALL